LFPACWQTTPRQQTPFLLLSLNRCCFVCFVLGSGFATQLSVRIEESRAAAGHQWWLMASGPYSMGDYTIMSAGVAGAPPHRARRPAAALRSIANVIVSCLSAARSVLSFLLSNVCAAPAGQKREPPPQPNDGLTLLERAALRPSPFVDPKTNKGIVTPVPESSLPADMLSPHHKLRIGSVSELTE
jgi:hypothetical protein